MINDFVKLTSRDRNVFIKKNEITHITDSFSIKSSIHLSSGICHCVEEHVDEVHKMIPGFIRLIIRKHNFMSTNLFRIVDITAIEESSLFGGNTSRIYIGRYEYHVEESPEDIFNMINKVQGEILGFTDTDVINFQQRKIIKLTQEINRLKREENEK